MHELRMPPASLLKCVSLTDTATLPRPCMPRRGSQLVVHAVCGRICGGAGRGGVCGGLGLVLRRPLDLGVQVAQAALHARLALHQLVHLHSDACNS